MATFKEIAEYILSLPVDVQNETASFSDMLDDRLVYMTGKNYKISEIEERDYNDNVLIENYHSIMCGDLEIEDKYYKYES